MSNILNVLKATGAIMEGHFQLTSGRHSNVYLEKFRLLERPHVVDEIGLMMARAFPDREIGVVLGAAVGGILLSHATARALDTRSIFAERVDGRLALRRGFQLAPGDNVLVVEDIVTTGGSVKELLDIVRKHQARTVGVACLVDRSEGGMDLGCPVETLARFPARSWDSGSCPLCRKDVPLESRGRTGKNSE
ncbi:MAG: orotate phosphoribosyltransferase [Fidelibacterota bacterium]